MTDTRGPRTTALDIAGRQYRPGLARLYDRWHGWNADLFDGALREPLLAVGMKAVRRVDTAHTLGVTGPSRFFAGTTVITLHGGLFVAGRRSATSWLPKRTMECYRAGVLLHEMVHQWELEVAGPAAAAGVHHGAAFAGKAGELAARLGLPPGTPPAAWPLEDPHLFADRIGEGAA